MDWYFEDVGGGERIGPCSLDQMLNAISDKRIDGRTLVWNSALNDWTEAAKTDLASSLSRTPPPLPLTSISNVWVYALASFPLWGTFLIMACLSTLVDANIIISEFKDSVAARNVMENTITPYIFFISGNGILSYFDERKLHKVGIRIQYGLGLAMLLVPVYLFMRGRVLKRTYRGVRRNYVPFWTWFPFLVLGVILQNNW